MLSIDPSCNGVAAFAVESPAVSSPKLRVCARPMNEIATISPELAAQSQAAIDQIK